MYLIPVRTTTDNSLYIYYLPFVSHETILLLLVKTNRFFGSLLHHLKNHNFVFFFFVLILHVLTPPYFLDILGFALTNRLLTAVTFHKIIKLVELIQEIVPQLDNDFYCVPNNK